MVTTDTVNYLRLLLLNVEGGTPVLREVFLKEVKNSSAKGNIDDFLNYFKADIDVLKHRQLISIAAYKTLFPDHGTKTDILEWDVSLLSVVLLQCCTLVGKLGKLKGILNQEVQSSKFKQLDTFLLDNKVTIDNLRSADDITGEQYEKLFPPSTQTCLDDWDTDLLIVILLKLCKPSNAGKVTQTLREAVYIDVKLCDTGLNVDVFLKDNFKTIEALRNEGKITDSQYDQLYPKNGVQSDIITWDDSLLRKILLHVCKSLSSNTISSIKIIRCFRNTMVAHKGNAAIDNDTFLKRWMENYKAIRNILDIVPHIKDDVTKAIDKFSCGALDIQSTVDILNTSHLKDETILAELRTSLSESEANINQHIDKRFDDLGLLIKECTNAQYKCVRKIKIPGFRAELHLFSNDEETVDAAEKLMLAGLNANPRTDAFEQFVKAIEGEDTKILKFTTGSVILHIQFDSTAALLTCLQYYESGKMQESVLPIQALLRRTLSCDLEISIHLNENDLAHIRDVIVSDTENEISNTDSDDEFQRSIHLMLESNSLAGMYRVWESFRSGDVANNLNIVSEELSTRLGRPVKVSASINFEEFKSAFESAEKDVEFTVPLSNIETAEGQDVTLECTVSKSDLTAVWTKDGSLVKTSPKIKPKSVDTTHSLNIQNVTIEDSAEYECKVGDASTKVTLTVEESPVEFTRKLVDIDVGEIPGAATFECELNMDNVPVKWYRDNKALESSDKYKMVDEGPLHKLMISDIDGEDKGPYSVVAKGQKSEAFIFVEGVRAGLVRKKKRKKAKERKGVRAGLVRKNERKKAKEQKAAVLPPSPGDSDSGVYSDLESNSEDERRLQDKKKKLKMQEEYMHRSILQEEYKHRSIWQEEYMHRSISEDLNRSFESSYFNEEARSMDVEACQKRDALNSFVSIMLRDYTMVIMGSIAEGTSLHLPNSDVDMLVYQDFIEADPGKCKDSNYPYVCMVKNKTTPIGYTKLQLYLNGEPAKNKPWLKRYYSSDNTLAEDNNYNWFITNISTQTAEALKHGPALSQKDVVGYRPVDYVRAYACKDLPEEITLWFQRKRPYGWPSPVTCELFKKMGCFVVGVGHLKSSEKDLEWRLSFSYQERHLMLNLNPTQYRCYILLKLIKKYFFNEIGDSDFISSYHCKTALFYTIENNSQTIWRPDNLSVCLKKCLQQLYKWIVEKNCPNYFIPEENMFETKQSDEQQTQNAKFVLETFFSSYYDMLAVLIQLLYRYRCFNVKDWVMENNARDMRFHLTDMTRYASDIKPLFATNIKKVILYLEDLMERMEIISEVLQRKDQVTTFQPFTENILRLLMDNPLLDESNIDILCSNKNIILEMFNHVKQHIRSNIACLFLAKFLQDTGNKLWNSLEGMKYEKEALKVDACQYYMKKASVFFMKGQYCLCSETLTKSMIMAQPIPLLCSCTNGRKMINNYQDNVYGEGLQNELKTILTSDMNAEELLYKIPTCLKFDSLEMNMVPIPLTFEGYRSFGVPVTTVELFFGDSWYDRVVTDPSVYLWFLQYKNYELLNDVGAGNHALHKLKDIILDGLLCDTVVHLETALNALGHIYITKGWYRLALQCFKQSWVIRPLHNAAKWHVMFMLFAEKYI